MARKLYRTVGAPNLKFLKMMIRQNSIHNFTFTVEDIDVVENIFGTSVSTLKRTTTRQRPKVVVDDFI